MNEQAPYHTADQPFCSDPDCPCHSDETLFDEYIGRPVLEGRLTVWDAQALLWPEEEGDIEQPEDSHEYLQDLNGHNQEVLWERVQEASQISDAQIEYEAEMAREV